MIVVVHCTSYIHTHTHLHFVTESNGSNDMHNTSAHSNDRSNIKQKRNPVTPVVVHTSILFYVTQKGFDHDYGHDHMNMIYL